MPPSGYSLVRALLHIVRHDLDVIMAGDIRNQETARMVIENTLTCHLVLSTPHTNDAVNTVS